MTKEKETMSNDLFAPSTIRRSAFGGDKPVGHVVTGTITEQPTEIQQTNFETGVPETWDDGRPKTQVLVLLQTDLREDDDDDGIRVLYCRGGKASGGSGGRTLLEAIKAAAQEAKCRIEVGGTLTVKYAEDGPVTRRGFNPPKLYKAKYVAPQKTATSTALDF